MRGYTARKGKGDSMRFDDFQAAINGTEAGGVAPASLVVVQFVVPEGASPGDILQANLIRIEDHKPSVNLLPDPGPDGEETLILHGAGA